MSSGVDLLQTVLAKHNYSLTKPRRLVFNALYEQEPSAMKDLITQLQPHIDRVSVYRTVGLFEKLGVAQRVYVGWKYKVELTDVFSHHHHHVSCLRCGKLAAITEDAEIEKLIEKLAAHTGFTAERHQLEIQGLCTSCQLENRTID